MYVNQLIEAWERGSATFGYWLMIPSPATTEIVAATDPDYVCFDQQHGLIATSDMVAMLHTVHGHRSAAITRVPANQPNMIGRALDLGCVGVVVPMIESGEEAADAVAACRYPPRGRRSFGPIRAVRVTNSSDPQDLENVACIVMVETAAGLQHVDEIAATPGVGAVYIGPADLALALGNRPKFGAIDQETEAAIQRIKQACDRAGVAVGIQTNSGEAARSRAREGFRMVTVATDAAILASGATTELLTARATENGVAAPPDGYA